MAHRLAVTGLVLALISVLSFVVGFAFVGPWLYLAGLFWLAALVVSIVSIRRGAGRDVAAVIALVLVGGELLFAILSALTAVVFLTWIFAPRPFNTVSSCSAYGAIACASYHPAYDLRMGMLSANLTNRLAQPIRIVGVTERNWSMCSVGSWNVSGGAGEIGSGSNFTLTVRCDPPPGQRNWANLVVEYVVNGSVERTNLSLKTDSVFAEGW